MCSTLWRGLAAGDLTVLFSLWNYVCGLIQHFNSSAFSYDKWKKLFILFLRLKLLAKISFPPNYFLLIKNELKKTRIYFCEKTWHDTILPRCHRVELQKCQFVCFLKFYNTMRSFGKCVWVREKKKRVAHFKNVLIRKESCLLNSSDDNETSRAITQMSLFHSHRSE